MSALAEQQQALLNALFAWPADTAEAQLHRLAQGVGNRPGRGLQAYQAHGHALAERALHSAFPVLAQLMGQQGFTDLARAFWHSEPPQRGDIAQWGASLARFVHQSPQLHEVPYLGDVARLEWALHQCATAAEGVAELGSLALLMQHDPETLGLQMAPGWCVVGSRWPVVSIWRAHQEDGPPLDQVDALLRQQVSEEAVVWRSGFKPLARQALPGEAVLLQALQTGHSLAAALAMADDLDFSQWLPMAVQTGLVLRVVPWPSSFIGDPT